ncbi:hypothetical protein FACS1894156_2530 [Bacteroidia bacterium]|nr:hypothetical protein FACS1894156_2530 [Bacteroidia bacterium]
MKCIIHNEIDSVATCGRCGAGLCKECVKNTLYWEENHPMCEQCNTEVYQQYLVDATIKLKKLKNRVIFLVVVLIIGLVAELILLSIKNFDYSIAIAGTILIWGIVSIGEWNKRVVAEEMSVKQQVSDAIDEHRFSFINMVIKLLKFALIAVLLPIFLIIAIRDKIVYARNMSEEQQKYEAHYAKLKLI